MRKSSWQGGTSGSMYGSLFVVQSMIGRFVFAMHRQYSNLLVIPRTWSILSTLPRTSHCGTMSSSGGTFSPTIVQTKSLSSNRAISAVRRSEAYRTAVSSIRQHDQTSCRGRASRLVRWSCSDPVYASDGLNLLQQRRLKAMSAVRWCSDFWLKMQHGHDFDTLTRCGLSGGRRICERGMRRAWSFIRYKVKPEI